MISLENANRAIEETLKKAESAKEIIEIFNVEGTKISLADAEEILGKVKNWAEKQDSGKDQTEPANMKLKETPLASQVNDFFRC